MKKGLRMFLLAGIAASLAATVPFGLAACDDPENNPCADGTHVDSNGDGICDKCETAMPDPNACPNGGTHVDTNNDGKCDKCGGAYSGGSTVIPIENYRFTVTVTSLGGFGLKDVYVTVKDASGKETRASTNADGVAGFMLDPAAYTVTLSNLPAGYHCEESYTASASNKNFSIRLESSVILGTAPTGTRYRVGDVLYDFTYTVDGETYQLSELLQENRAVFLNFWATWCGPCMSEFPYLNAAYRGWQTKVETDEAFKERGMEMLAISGYDSATAVAQTKASKGLIFPMMSDSVGITSMVSYSGSIPTTVIIDRYGVCAYIHSGSITSEKDWTDLFEKYTADDYVPPEPDPVNPDDPNSDTPVRVEPDIPNPVVEDIAAAATAEGNEFTYYWENKENDKYAWPWLVSEDGNSIYPGNTLHPYSYAIMYFDVTITEEDIANKRTAVAFDFHAETEADRDILYIVTDRKFARTLSGISQTEWEICYAHVFDTPGTHSIGLLYQKDTSTDVGSDRVTIKNIRLVKETEVEHAFYVQRDVATGERNAETGVYEKYETVVLNREDGYYHVGSVNGPLLLANLMGKTQYSEDNSFWNYVYLGQLVLDLGDGLKDYTQEGTYFANRAYSSDIEGCFPVTERLQKLLNGLAAKHATESGKTVNPKAWLEFCCYYAPYGTEEQISDPIRGITTHSAIELVLDDPDTTKVEKNTVDVYKLFMPRGFYYYFEPDVSGVYTFQSFGDRYIYGVKVDDEGMDTTAWIEEENGNFVQPKELIGDNDMNAQGDAYDFVLSVYLTAGKRYYLRTSFSSSETIGTYSVKVTYDGNEKEVWYHASMGYYTLRLDENGEPTDETYLPSIDYIYDKDEDRFYQKKANGEKGGMIYVDFGNGTYFTPDRALQYLVDINNMTHMITEKGPLVAPTFDFVLYTSGKFQIEDFANNREIITIDGKDYTERMKELRDEAMATVSTATDPNLKGCIPATAELVNILQVYTTFYGSGTFAPNIWLMLAYYYEHIGPTE